ncbi:MAG TPA: MFS transporter [Beijerinckiaceae bacterium]|jgi:MFS family permease
MAGPGGAAAPARTSPARRLPPEIVIVAGCLIAMITWGPRSAAGALQLPVLQTYGWSTEAYAFAFAIQNLLWGLFQPVAGAFADRVGTMRVLALGGLLYTSGVGLMAFSSTPATFTFTVGVLTGLGLSGCSLNLVVAGFGKIVPPKMRPVAFGLVTASASFGQFVFSPVAGALIETFDWRTACLVFAGLVLFIAPLSWFVASAPLAETNRASGLETKGALATLRDALSHRSYVLVVVGFFTCGFQLQFITVHFQRYIVESGLSANVGYWAFAMVGLFNIVGSLTAGWMCTRMPRRYVLAGVYFSRAVLTLIFINLPPAPINAYLFGALSGLLWLSTLPPTSAMVNQMFGSGNFGMLYGFAFCSHQIGGFLGVLLGGVLRSWTGSYDATWYLSIALGVASALITLPIVEKSVEQARAPAPA